MIVLHEAQQTAGFGAEVAATIAQTAFESLDAPPVRVASEDTPVPFSANLEAEVYSAKAKLKRAVEDILAWYRMLDFGMHHGDERASQGHERLQYLGKILLLCAQ